MLDCCDLQTMSYEGKGGGEDKSSPYVHAWVPREEAQAPFIYQVIKGTVIQVLSTKTFFLKPSIFVY